MQTMNNKIYSYPSLIDLGRIHDDFGLTLKLTPFKRPFFAPFFAYNLT